MEIRTLRESEKEKYAYMIKQAFQLPQSATDYFLQYAPINDLWGIFDEQGRIVSGLRILRNRLWVGAKPVEMTGITSVTTPPEHRRKGYLKQLLTQVLTSEREQGRNVSTLYPFDFGFYRKFGYELAGGRAKFQVGVGALTHFKSRTAGQWETVGPDEWQTFKDIYDLYCVGRFGRIERADEQWWQRRVFTVLNMDKPSKPQELYLWRDTQGVARAYMVCTFNTLKKDWEREVEIRDMAWTDDEARHELFSFLPNFDSQAVRVSWDDEPDKGFFNRLNDAYQAEVKLEADYMMRLLDVERALTERAWPTDARADFRVSVQDDIFEWNTGRTYQLAVREGQAEVSTTKGENAAGLSCNVRTLAQLYTGWLSPLQAVQLGKLKITRTADLEAAQRLFSPAEQPGSFMADHW